MPPDAPSMRRYYVVVTEIWTGEPARASHWCWNPFLLSLGSCNGLLFYVPHFLPFSLLLSLCLPPSLPYSHRETADHIEAVASRAVRASKQTFSFLMDLLLDNSTEEYIRNLTEQWAQKKKKNEPKHTPTQTSTGRKNVSHSHKVSFIAKSQQAAWLPGLLCFCSILLTKCTYPCITAQGSLLQSSLLKHIGV